MKLWFLPCTLLFCALMVTSPLAAAELDEAAGLVTHVTDGDTITVEGLGEIRLADINCPELDAPGGSEAKEFTREKLLNKQVYLDIDNKTGKDRYGRYVCIVYASGLDGTANVNQSFNRMLVDSWHAIVEDDKDNEFNPADWWASSKLQGQDKKKFVGSIESDKYHYPDCQWAKKINPENEIWFAGSEDARIQNYVPCGVCHPP